MVGFKKQGLGYGTYYSNQPNKPGIPKPALIIGLVLAVVLGGGMLFLTLTSANSRNDITLLAVRENSLLALANTAQKSIRDPDLSTANSNATLLLQSDVASMVIDTDIKKLPDDLVKKEADTHTDALKQASLLNKFDSTYRQLVLEKVSAIVVQAQTVRTNTSSKKSRAVIDQAIENLQSIDKQFTDLTIQ
jgi:hypothetical protein